MFNLNAVSSVAQLFALIITALIGLYGIWRRIDKRQTESQIQTIRINDKLDRIELQFGPNGGGIREAVNTMSAKVDKIETRVNTIDTKLANLGGKFDQHIIETDN
jgi:archaellum component FlaC